MRTNYIESNIEEDIDKKNQYRIKNPMDPISIREPASKLYVDKNFNDPRTIKNITYVDFKDKNLDNILFVKVKSVAAVEEHSTAKYYADQAISNSVDEPTLVRNNQDNDFNNCNLTNKNSNTSDTQAVYDNQVITKSFVDQFHQKNEQCRRDLGLYF